MEFKVVDSKKWDTLPVPTPQKPKNQYEAVIEALEKGNIIQLTATDAKQLKGMRIALGRLSSQKGFAIELRSEELSLYVKKSDKELAPKEPKQKKLSIDKAVAQVAAEDQKKKEVASPPNSDWDKWNGALTNEPEKEPEPINKKA